MPYECSVQTTYWGNRLELVEVLDLAARGLLTAHTSTFDLAQAPEVYARPARGKVDERAVALPNRVYRP